MKVFESLLMGLSFVMAQYDYSPLVPMWNYTKEYRTLTCWECFEAQGKMCFRMDGKSMMLETGSSNRGHGICCKPNATEGICSGDDGIHECSMPVSGNDTDPELHDILTESPNGLVNH